MRQQLKLWDSKRERERKLTVKSANQTHCWPIRRTKEGLSNSRDELVELVGGRPAHPPLEAGGSGEGKGAGSAPRTASPTALQTGLQFLTKDFLRFWRVNICQEGCG